jgi:DNA-binding CsgD family transcriptional regulator
VLAGGVAVGSWAMQLDDAVARIEGCRSMDELKQALQTIGERYGFASFSFLDTGASHLDVPFYFGTLRPDFVSGYAENKLVHVDHCVARARRSNSPFSWGEVPVPPAVGLRKSSAQTTMEFAYDHGYQEGFVVPFHFADPIGRLYSSVVVFFWTDPAKRFRFLMSRKRLEMHLVMTYWAQRAVDIIGEQCRGGSPFGLRETAEAAPVLTDRERDVLAWAARGKSALDTAEILTLSEETVTTHIRNAMKKLGANNKTHAVAKAIYRGLINV